MKRTTFAVLLILIFFGLACNNDDVEKDSSSDPSSQVIKFEPQGGGKVFIEDIADTSFFRVLSTDQDFLLSYIDKIFFSDSLMIFPQRSEGVVYLYDLEGNPVRKIDAIGRGAGEATGITDVWYSKDTELIDIYDSSLSKVLTYSLTGELVDERKVEKPDRGGLQIQFARSNDLAVFERLIAGPDNDMRLGLYDTEMEFQSSVLPIPEKLKNVNLRRTHVLEVYKDSIYYLPLLQNRIVAVNKNGVSTAFGFDIPKAYRFSEKYLNGTAFRKFGDYHAEMRNTDHIYTYDMLYITDKHISFNYKINKGKHNRSIRNSIYVSKETGNTLQFSYLGSRESPDMELPDVVVRGAMNGYFVVTVRATQNIYLPEDIQEQLDDNSNSVLLFFKLKEF